MNSYPFCEGHRGRVTAEVTDKVPANRGQLRIEVSFK